MKELKRKMVVDRSAFDLTDLLVKAASGSCSQQASLLPANSEDWYLRAVDVFDFHLITTIVQIHLFGTQRFEVLRAILYSDKSEVIGHTVGHAYVHLHHTQRPLRLCFHAIADVQSDTLSQFNLHIYNSGIIE